MRDKDLISKTKDSFILMYSLRKKHCYFSANCSPALYYLFRKNILILSWLDKYIIISPEKFPWSMTGKVIVFSLSAVIYIQHMYNVDLTIHNAKWYANHIDSIRSRGRSGRFWEERACKILFPIYPEKRELMRRNNFGENNALSNGTYFLLDPPMVNCLIYALYLYRIRPDHRSDGTMNL